MNHFNAFLPLLGWDKFRCSFCDMIQCSAFCYTTRLGWVQSVGVENGSVCLFADTDTVWVSAPRGFIGEAVWISALAIYVHPTFPTRRCVFRLMQSEQHYVSVIRPCAQEFLFANHGRPNLHKTIFWVDFNSSCCTVMQWVHMSWTLHGLAIWFRNRLYKSLLDSSLITLWCNYAYWHSGSSWIKSST